MALNIYNTLTKKKEEFRPLEDSKVKIYACGVTLYDELHLGHARAAVIFDLMRRYLEHKNYKVTYVTNFTDVDDKMINRANEVGISVFDLAKRFMDQYFHQMQQLGVKKADHYPRATEHIEDIIKLIKKLEDKDIAYAVGGNVFFRINRFPEYGKLSGQSPQELFAGARIQVDEKKESPYDFALWKRAKQGEPSWDSPWGEGRPGWHIECSAMAIKYLGESIDVHGGGKDLIFPHHENEIAQSEAATEKEFAHFWVHNGLVTINQQKMAKSLKNFITLSRALQEYRGEIIRYYLLSAHYRSPLNFTQESLDEASSSIQRVYTVLDKIDEVVGGQSEEGVLKQKVPEDIERLSRNFFQSMDDDFNTPCAFAAIFELVKEANSTLEEPVDKHSRAKLACIAHKIRDLGKIMGLFQEKKQEKLTGKTEQLIGILIEVREKLRAEKNWPLADYIRDELKQAGIQLEDKKEGTRWRVN